MQSKMFNIKIYVLLGLIVGLTPQTNAESKDWRDTGCISEPVDQGRCESCSIMSSISLLETKLCLSDPGRNLVELSHQQVIDCLEPERFGCKNGNPSKVFEYLKNLGKIALRDQYPYESRTYRESFVGDCKVPIMSENQFISVKYANNQFNFKRLGRANCEREMMKYLRTTGPVSSYVTGAKAVLKNYHGGILDDTQCNPNKKDEKHGIVVVGYGSEGGVDYWIVKNSFGTNWGEAGYFRLRRGIAGGACSICHLAWVLI